MRRYWQYLKHTLKHKWFVLIEGIKIGVPIHLLILHDISKFRPSEFFAYARTFYAPDGKSQYKTKGTGFDMAWLHHQNRNRHHWQYWMLFMDAGYYEYLPMPDRYRKEMLADWKGAGRATGRPDTKDWYLKNEDNICLHKETRDWIEKEIFS